MENKKNDFAIVKKICYLHISGQTWDKFYSITHPVGFSSTQAVNTVQKKQVPSSIKKSRSGARVYRQTTCAQPTRDRTAAERVGPCVHFPARFEKDWKRPTKADGENNFSSSKK